MGGLFSRPVSRRTLLGGALTMAGAGVAAGCSSPLAAGLTGGELSPGTVQYWNLFSGGDGTRMVSMENVYRAEHGANSLEAATFAWGNPYYTKVSLATLSAAPPDVAVSHLTRAINLARGGLLEQITDETLGLAGLHPGDFNQLPWRQQQLDGKSYAIPFDTHPFVLYYNEDVCRKAGLLDGDGRLKPIQGVEAFEAALTAARQVTGAYGLSVATVGDTATSWRWFTTLYNQMKGNTPFLSDQGRQLSYNEDLAIKALTYMQSLMQRGLVPATTDYAGSQTLMFTGKSGFYLQGEWEITTAQSVKGLNFGMTVIPQLFDQPACQGDSHCFVLPRKERSPESRKRAMGFIKSMLDQSLTWAKGGHIPAYLPALQSPEYRQLSPQNNYASAVEHVTYDPPAWYSGSGSTFENIIGAQIGLVQQGLATPQEGLNAARALLETYAKTADPLV